MRFLSHSLFLSAVLTTVTATAVVSKAYIITLTPGTSHLASRSVDHINAFHKRATGLDYTVRHEFSTSDAYVGLSIAVSSEQADEDIIAQLEAIAEVASVSRVYIGSIPILPDVPKTSNPMLSFANPPALNVDAAAAVSANLSATLQMGGVDKLHALGIKGSGIKIGIIDTGVDYRHPALGAGFGPGKKIAGGYAFVTDSGAATNSPDPLTTCFGGGHGTHVAGIIGMNPVTGGFNVAGVAPDASLYIYKALGCSGTGGSDAVVAALLKAQSDGVQLVSMSIGFGAQSFSGAIDPLGVVTKSLTDAGITVIIAAGNSGPGLYTAGSPATLPNVIGVGSIANSVFPLVYTATDSAGKSIQYASIYPLNYTSGADVYVLDSGCSTDNWESALAAIGSTNINNTIIAFQSDTACTAAGAGNWNGGIVLPVTIMTFNANSSNPYDQEYASLSPGYYGPIQTIKVNAADGQVFASNYAAAGGYKKYKLFFTSSAFTSPPQITGGLMDYYSGYGPTWHDYNLKPQVSAPGGHILATWPLGVGGGYCILSGTSMATPYFAGAYALVKSKFPNYTISQILSLLQTTSQSLPWVYDKTIITGTAQQGAGLLNVYAAIYNKGVVSPGSIKVTDITHTQWGVGNITIKNTAGAVRTYVLSHQGAGYMNYYRAYQELEQRAMYGSATFSKSSVNVQAGGTMTLTFKISPPSGVTPQSLPVFGGFIKIKDTTTGEAFSIPYIGPPYSQFNTPYLYNTTAVNGVRLPSVGSGTGVTNTGFLAVNVGVDGYTTVIPTVEWTQEFRVDLLPANTTIAVTNFGYDRAVTYPYVPSAVTPKTTIFGVPSFGNLANRTGYLWPGSYGPIGTKDTGVVGPDGIKYLVGNGDYRFLASVLRWSGTKGLLSDYDTWLSPVMRFTS